MGAAAAAVLEWLAYPPKLTVELGSYVDYYYYYCEGAGGLNTAGFGAVSLLPCVKLWGKLFFVVISEHENVGCLRA